MYRHNVMNGECHVTAMDANDGWQDGWQMVGRLVGRLVGRWLAMPTNVSKVR